MKTKDKKLVRIDPRLYSCVEDFAKAKRLEKTIALDLLVSTALGICGIYENGKRG
jgi:hypothetical protein